MKILKNFLQKIKDFFDTSEDEKEMERQAFKNYLIDK
jgi:hypothetical protein